MASPLDVMKTAVMVDMPCVHCTECGVYNTYLYKDKESECLTCKSCGALYTAATSTCHSETNPLIIRSRYQWFDEPTRITELIDSAASNYMFRPSSSNEAAILALGRQPIVESEDSAQHRSKRRIQLLLQGTTDATRAPPANTMRVPQAVHGRLHRVRAPASRGYGVQCAELLMKRNHDVLRRKFFYIWRRSRMYSPLRRRHQVVSSTVLFTPSPASTGGWRAAPLIVDQPRGDLETRVENLRILQEDQHRVMRTLYESLLSSTTHHPAEVQTPAPASISAQTQTNSLTQAPDELVTPVIGATTRLAASPPVAALPVRQSPQPGPQAMPVARSHVFRGRSTAEIIADEHFSRRFIEASQSSERLERQAVIRDGLEARLSLSNERLSPAQRSAVVVTESKVVTTRSALHQGLTLLGNDSLFELVKSHDASRVRVVAECKEGLIRLFRMFAETRPR